MTTSPGDRPIEVLLVEDDPADARLTQETLKGSKHRVNVAVAEDGEAAMAYLRQGGEYSSAPRPDLVLLDLKLRKKSGEEVLEEMNQDPDLVQIPVMILTSTQAERSRLVLYNIPPSRWCGKPLDLARFHLAVRQLGILGKEPSPTRHAGAHTGERSAEESSRGKKWWWPYGHR